jgi:hypothetical protein
MERDLSNMYYPWHKEAQKIKEAEEKPYKGGYERSHI